MTATGDSAGSSGGAGRKGQGAGGGRVVTGVEGRGVGGGVVDENVIVQIGGVQCDGKDEVGVSLLPSAAVTLLMVMLALSSLVLVTLTSSGSRAL